MKRAFPRRTAVGIDLMTERDADTVEEGLSAWAYFACRAPEPPDWFDRSPLAVDATQDQRLTWEEDRWFAWRSYYATRMLAMEPRQ